MSADELKLNRKRLGLTIPTMAKILYTTPNEYKRYEKDGLRAPHDTEGPTVRLVQLLTFSYKTISSKEAKRMRKSLGYIGPEKKYAGVELIHK